MKAGWGSLGLIQNELDGIQELLGMGDDWGYFILLSGDSFPLMTQERLVEVLLELGVHNNYLTLSGHRPENLTQPWKQARTDQVAWPEGLDAGISGSQWVTLTRDFAYYAASSATARNLLVAFTKARVPDEGFFQTLLINNPHFLPTTLLEGHHPKPFCRFEKWGSCYHSIPGRDPKAPCYLGEKDFDDMVHSGCGFARKFNLNTSMTLYSKLKPHIVIE